MNQQEVSMAEFAYADINDAKRRVQEMKNKAREHAADTAKPEKPDALELISRLSSNKDKALVLSVLYLLSHENADDALLLSLLYILL
jgi:hypothetical protein